MYVDEDGLGKGNGKVWYFFPRIFNEGNQSIVQMYPYTANQAGQQAGEFPTCQSSGHSSVSLSIYIYNIIFIPFVLQYFSYR